jgi:hypothetical protein
MGSGPKPNLVKTTALSKAQGLFARINSLLPSYSTPISPSTVYQPLPANIGTGAVVGNELLINTSGALWGVWVAPDINSGADYPVQVECFAAGGGGGGGTITPGSGGGGGGGGEYACEPTYTITPGLAYIWIRGIGGQAGFANTNNQLVEGGGGFSGGDTIFDVSGVNLPGGVHAHGGAPGDGTAPGQGGLGGSGSANTIASAGGAGATNNSGYASDNPLAFLSNPGSLWAHLPPSIPMWLPMDDFGTPLTQCYNEANPTGTPAGVTNFTGGAATTLSPAAPNQVPTQNNFTDPNGNFTEYGSCVQITKGNVNNPSARINCPSFGFSGSYLMISGWVQCDPSGIWGPPSIANVTIAANCAYPNANVPGIGLFFRNTGSSGAPVWQLGLYCGQTSSIKNTILAPASATTPTPSTWYYVVGVFNNGTMTLYVNGTSVQSGAAGFTTVGGGAYPMALALRPDTNTGGFFGYMSNFWFAEGVPNTALLTTAFGSSPPTGGAGGGASGGPSTSIPATTAPYFVAGGAGVEASGITGGQGGTPPAQQPLVSQITTDGQGGGAGSNSGVNKGGTLAIQGAGGGGCGASTSLLAPTTLTEVVTTAASYNGIDGTNPGALYNPNQQGTQSTLIAGGQASDPTTGSKNAILLLPPGLATTLTGKTIVDCYLTVYNANPTNTIDPILEVNYSADASLPTLYENTAAYSSITQLAPYVLQSSTDAQQISLMNTALPVALQNGTATAIVIGPGGTAATPPNAQLDAYNAPAANYFYTSIYGPGATDSFGNSLEPVLTVIYTTGTPFRGQTAGGGYIAITAINNEAIPVATVEPFAVTDAEGNQLGAGFTGQIQAFNPMTANQTPGAFKPEIWHDMTPYLINNWSAVTGYAVGFRLTAQGDLQLTGRISTTTTGTGVGIAVLPAGYFTAAIGANNMGIPIGLISGTPAANLRLLLSSTGGLSISSITSGNNLSLDGVSFPISVGPYLPLT